MSNPEPREPVEMSRRLSLSGGLVQGMWNEELNRAVVYKIKGKFPQHMGRMVNGNVTLSPEATVFLLEKDLLELKYRGRQMNTEEAHLIILKETLAMQKYKVYSYLSNLGYIVVSHQEKLHTLEKRNCEKRKQTFGEGRQYSQRKKRKTTRWGDSGPVNANNREVVLKNKETDLRICNLSETTENGPIGSDENPLDSAGNHTAARVEGNVIAPDTLKQNEQSPAPALRNEHRELPNAPAEDGADDNGQPLSEAVPNGVAREESLAFDNVKEKGAGDCSEPVPCVDNNSDGAKAGNVEDDIVFIEVTRTEKKPLAVIDLLDRDEDVQKGDPSQEESCNDDVQIINVCPISPSTKLRIDRRLKPAVLDANLKNKPLDHSEARVEPKSNRTGILPTPIQQKSPCRAGPPLLELPLNPRLAGGACIATDTRTLTKTNDSHVWSRRWNNYNDLPERRNFFQHNYGPQWIRPFYSNFGQPDAYDMRGSNQGHGSNSYGYGNNDSLSPSPFIMPPGITNAISPQRQNVPLPVHMVPPFFHMVPPPVRHMVPPNIQHMVPPNIQHMVLPSAQPMVNVFKHAPFGPKQLATLNQMAINLIYPAPQTYPSTNAQDFVAYYPANCAYAQPEEVRRIADNTRNLFYQNAPCPQLPYSSNKPKKSFRDQQWSNSGNSNNRSGRGLGDKSNNFSKSKKNPPPASSKPEVDAPTESMNKFKSTRSEVPDAEDDDVIEVPVYESDVLWCRKLTPLVGHGVQNIEDASKALSITKRINLESNVSGYRCMSNRSDLEISFDVYLPGSAFRPSVPSYRIVVLRVVDFLPKMLDVIKLLYKFDDSATLQFAVVDDGNVVLYSFSFPNF